MSASEIRSTPACDRQWPGKLLTIACISIVCNVSLVLAAPSITIAPAAAVLDITIGAQVRHYSRTELLAHPAIKTIEVPDDVSYHRPMHYRAVPLSALTPALAEIDTLQFTASDGFVANIPGPLLAAGQPWLAIEPADAPWPTLKAGGASAGPYYLVWLKTEKAEVSPEQWPYRIARIAAALPFESRYPQVLPKATLAADSPERRGLQVYVANCASCHRINGGGDAAIGPDLNLPLNPTEYFQEPALRKLIRNPASVRTWPGSIMPGFSTAVLSEAKLDDLLHYLRSMVAQRALGTDVQN